MPKKTKSEEKAQQKQPTPIRREIRGIIFTLIVVILGVSLFSFHPKDPVFAINTGQANAAYNLFGTVGAHLSGWIFSVFGFSSFWLVVAFVAMAILSFQGKRLPSPIKNIIAILCLVTSFAGILGLSLPGKVSYRGGLVIGGGLAGDFLASNMQGLLNHFGSYVLLVTAFLLSLMVTTRISFGSILSAIFRWSVLIARPVKEYFIMRKERRRKRKVREETIKKAKRQPRRKVTIVEPKREPPKKPAQEAFAFMDLAGKFKLPPMDLLDEPQTQDFVDIQKDSLEMNARRVEKKLADFGVEGEVVEILPGPVVTMYEFKPAAGIKISKVAGLSDDLALVLRAPSVRIIAPIPGKAAIGIEIANNQRAPVGLRQVLSSQAFQESTHKLSIGLGTDIAGAPFVTDLARMPHLLVAGATGTGKSVSLNAMINSFLFKVSPDLVRFVMIDPKRIELSIYKDIPHLLHPVVTEPKEATRALRWAVQEMERRYMLLSDRGVRNIEAYNRKVLKGNKDGKKKDDAEPEKTLPYIILVIDELADLMMVSSRDVEESITRLAQMARAAGIHLIIATQRPSVDVLTGIIKANFPARISFQVSSRVDSRTILDCIGAENLLGEGDMLFLPPGVARLTRIHGAYISEEEVKRVTDFLRDQMKPDYDSTIMEEVAKDDTVEEDDVELDEKYDRAVEVVMQTGMASISMLQRKLRVGYNRAARMIETMEKQGLVGPSDGVRQREVFGRREE